MDDDDYDYHDLIASDQVEGVAAFDGCGKELGSIRRFLVNKETGNVAYAVVHLSGLFGLFAHDYAIPWAGLSYEAEFKGYIVAYDQATLAAAPKIVAGEAHHQDFADEVSTYYAGLNGLSSSG